MKKLLMAAAVLALATACTESGGSGSGLNGRTRILLTDDPFPYDAIKRVDVYIKSISASTSLDTTGDTTSGGGQHWVTVATPEKVYNLLDFQAGNTVLAGEVDLAAGQYRAIRIVINTSLSHVIRNNGTEVPVQWPVPGELTLNAYVEHALDVSSDGAQIVIDFDVGRTFMDNGQGGFWFIPWIRAVNDAATGDVGGTVSGPDIEGNATAMPNIAVSAYTAGVNAHIVGTARTDSLGRYVIAYLPAGDYTVKAMPPSMFAFVSPSVSAHITAGNRATANISLTRDTTTGGGGGGTDTSTTTPGGAVASITLRVGTPTGSTNLQTCDSVPMIAELRNAQNQILLGRSIAWHVTDSTVLSLQGVFGQYAHLRALKAGSVTLTATSEGKSTSLPFTVTGANCSTGGGGGGGIDTSTVGGPVATVTIGPATMNAAVGDSLAAYASLKNASGASLSGRPVTFSISDTTVVRITGVFGQSIIMRSLKVGSATLTATSEGKVGTAAITVH